LFPSFLNLFDRTKLARIVQRQFANINPIVAKFKYEVLRTEGYRGKGGLFPEKIGEVRHLLKAQ
jgi:hypothetical protein